MNTHTNSVQHEKTAHVLSRTAVFLFGVAAYVVFLATFVYAIGFVGNIGVPKSLDSPGTGSGWNALWIDLGLLSLFALQHSIMARPAFKRVITRFIPRSAERSTYVLASSLALCLLFWQWQPLGGSIWDVDSMVGRGILYAGFAFGWGLVLITTFVINHFDLFGLRQVWREVKGQPQAKVQFVVPVLYRIVRHPLYVGWLFAFWCTPTMTITHLLFATVTTAYILVAIRFEEADLVNEHHQYAVYRKQVPMLIPRLTREVTLAGAEAMVNRADSGPVMSRNPAAGLGLAAVLCLVLTSTATAQMGRVAVPPVPDNLKAPSGHTAYLKTSAVGTQNYVCLPGAEGPTWTFLGPQATLFVTFPWFGGQAQQQVTTHFLSSNPSEAGTARPAWHHSADSSTIWGRVAANSTDPIFVAPGSIPWLLVEIVGTQRGPTGGTFLTDTTYIHRLNTSGGVKPNTGCEAQTIGAVALVPYSTDYYFYKRSR
ncbi:MAG: DUF3455 domain-containing protein [Bryobacterales bacterium]|nr:DUF3455 domain-containing protein [Bryobacterales bacterium]